jgi:hypothetical protein
MRKLWPWHIYSERNFYGQKKRFRPIWNRAYVPFVVMKNAENGWSVTFLGYLFYTSKFKEEYCNGE